MAYRFSFNYYYVTPEDEEKMSLFCEASGDTPQYLRMQYIRGWLGRNRAYYTKLAKMDRKKRGISAKQWKEVVLNYGFNRLPDYKTPIDDEELGKNPLAHIILPANVVKRTSNYVQLTGQNLILIRTGIYYDRDNTRRYVSRIIREHIDRNWETLYAPQIEAENSDNWLEED